MATVNLTKVGGLVKVEVDSIIKGYYPISSVPLKLSVDGSGIEAITIGDLYQTVSAITDIEIDGTPITDLTDFETQIATVFPEANGGSGGSAAYLVYTALLSQTGTDAPVADFILQNSFGGTVVLARENLGIYTGTLAGMFLNRKFFVPGLSDYNGAALPVIPVTDYSGGVSGYYTIYPSNDNSFRIETYNTAMAAVEFNTLFQDSRLCLEVKAYPNP